MIISIIFWLLASIMNAVCDNLAHHYYKSVFKKDYKPVNEKWNNFWNPELSWKLAYVIPHTKYKLDAWHLFKSAMIVFLGLSITFAWISQPPFINTWWFYTGFLLFIGTIWNLVFNLFYNHILNKK